MKGITMMVSLVYLLTSSRHRLASHETVDMDHYGLNAFNHRVLAFQNH